MNAVDKLYMTMIRNIESLIGESMNARIERLRLILGDYFDLIEINYLKKSLDGDQVEDLKNVAFKNGKNANLAVSLLLNVGLRLGEIIHLRKMDIDVESQEIIVQDHVNGEKVEWTPPTAASERRVKFNTDVAKDLYPLLEKAIKNEDYILSSGSKKGESTRYSQSSFVTLINRVALQAESIKKNIGTNVMRRTCAMRRIENFEDPGRIARDMGYDAIYQLFKFCFDFEIRGDGSGIHAKLKGD